MAPPPVEWQGWGPAFSAALSINYRAFANDKRFVFFVISSAVFSCLSCAVLCCLTLSYRVLCSLLSFHVFSCLVFVFVSLSVFVFSSFSLVFSSCLLMSCRSCLVFSCVVLPHLVLPGLISSSLYKGGPRGIDQRAENYSQSGNRRSGLVSAWVFILVYVI
jgi:hypothetical protein